MILETVNTLAAAPIESGDPGFAWAGKQVQGLGILVATVLGLLAMWFASKQKWLKAASCFLGVMLGMWMMASPDSIGKVASAVIPRLLGLE